MTEEQIADLLGRVPKKTGYLREMDMPYLDFAKRLGIDVNAPGALYTLSQAANSYRAGAPIDALAAELVAAKNRSPEEIANMNAGSNANLPQHLQDAMSFGPTGAYTNTGWSSGEFDPNNILASGYLAPEGVRGLGYHTDGHSGVAFGDEAIGAVRDDMRDRAVQGAARVAALVGGAAALGATAWGSSAPGAASGAGASTTTATTFPLATGGPVTVSAIPGVTAGVPAAAGTLTPISVNAARMAGGNAAVEAASAAATNAGTLSQLPAAIATPEAVSTLTGAGARRGLGSRITNFLRDNKELVDLGGNVLVGLADEASQEDAQQHNLDLLRERDALTSAHYTGADPSRTFRGLARSNSGVSPSRRFEAYANWEYRYEPKEGRVVKVPIES